MSYGMNTLGFALRWGICRVLLCWEESGLNCTCRTSVFTIQWLLQSCCVPVMLWSDNSGVPECTNILLVPWVQNDSQKELGGCLVETETVDGQELIAGGQICKT